jgi:Polyketide cyclase / dehydrase and lipid transport
MWQSEHSKKAEVDPRAIWHAWTDVGRWPAWNADIEAIELRGSFAPGGTIAMKPRGAPTVELRIAEVVDGELFVDEAEVDGTIVRTLHRIERTDHGTRVLYRLEADGPAADQIGPAVTADFDETIAALFRHVRDDSA